MAVTIIKKAASGKAKKIVIKPKLIPASFIETQNVKVGQIYLDAKGENKGVVIRALDIPSDQVVVQDIDTQGKYALRTMPTHQCVMVDFYPVDPPYDEWVVRVVFGRAAAAKLKK